ncbi:putative alcohol dehydrogenase protein [Botrytis fragariae]|uniref:Putative alcohol dehydrogenase protein n=1 Tax=Botrytis fragariae TaxID=1964551 RepID=A0A8H6AIC3_9HELO|nr:putative alcohol dehydrogenase protein [Botrytis fragariae]KAF5867874.1 putative alcohol dehydrogenase protein [Botrytis fragariae]
MSQLDSGIGRGCSYSTAYLLLEKAAAGAGDVALIFGARGAVGKAAVELTNAKGLRIITTSRIDGAHVNITSDENLKSVLDSNNGREPSIILDCAGSSVLMEKGFAILEKSGRYVFVSGMRGGGPEVKIDVMKMLVMDQSLHGVNSWSVTLARTKDIMDNLGEMFEDGEIKGPEEESLTKIKLTDAINAYQEVAKFDGKKFSSVGVYSKSGMQLFPEF